MRWLQATYNNATGKKSTMADLGALKIKRYGKSCTTAQWTFNGVAADCLVNLYPKEWMVTEMTQDDLVTLDLA